MSLGECVSTQRTAKRRKSACNFCECTQRVRVVKQKLTYLKFIHGGGFALGTTSTMDAGRQLVSRAMSDGVRAPVMYVSANYRVNGACLVSSRSYVDCLTLSILFHYIAFGFLAGSEVAAEGGLNAGLLDRESVGRIEKQK